MTTFCVDKIALTGNLRAQHGILRAASLRTTSDAAAAARAIIEEAHVQAAAVLEQARQEAKATVGTAEQQTIARAQRLLQTLEHEHETFLERGKDVILGLAQGVFERLVRGMPQRERLESALRMVMAEAPRRLINPVLRVHPDDVQFLPELEWDIKEDDALVPGNCRLEAGNGEWSVDFEAAVASLKAAFAAFVCAAPQDSEGEQEQTA